MASRSSKPLSNQTIRRRLSICHNVVPKGMYHVEGSAEAMRRGFLTKKQLEDLGRLGLFDGKINPRFQKNPELFKKAKVKAYNDFLKRYKRFIVPVEEGFRQGIDEGNHKVLPKGVNQERLGQFKSQLNNWAMSQSYKIDAHKLNKT